MSSVNAGRPATRVAGEPLAIAARAGLVALLLAFVIAVHDRGGTTYDGCPVPEDPTTCQEAHR